MLCICTRDCQHKGVVVHRGETRELTDAELAARPRNFKPAAPTDAQDGGAPGQERPEDRPELFTRAQLKQHLDQMGVPYRVRDSYETLKDLYDRAVAADPRTRLGP